MKTTSILTLEVAGIFGPPQRIYAKQNDMNSRQVEVQINSGGVPLVFDAGTSAVMRFQMPDGSVIPPVDGIPDRTSIMFELSEAALSAPGIVTADVAITDSTGGLLSTFNFEIVVERKPSGGEYVPSEDGYKLQPNAINAAGAPFGYVLAVNGVGKSEFVDAGTGMTMSYQDFAGMLVGVFGHGNG